MAKIAKNTLIGKTNESKLALPNNTTSIIKAVCYWQKNWQTDQCDRFDSPEIDPRMYLNLVSIKGGIPNE